jgi:hypothetical protein
MYRNRGGVLLGIIVALLVLILAAVFIGPRIFLAHMANKAIRENPRLALQPVPLPAAAEFKPQSPPTKVEAYGYEFSVPWGKSEEPESWEYLEHFRFSGSTSLYFHNPATQFDRLDILKKTPDPRQREYMAKMYGMTDISTRYDEYRAMLLWKPSDSLSAFDSQEKLMAEYFQISQKHMALLSATSAIYEFAFGDLRGFQLGEPGKDGEIRIHAFDKEDQHLELRILRNSAGVAPLTQGEVNFVVWSLRRVLPEPEKSPAEKKPPRKSSPQKAPA